MRRRRFVRNALELASAVEATLPKSASSLRTVLIVAIQQTANASMIHMADASFSLV